MNQANLAEILNVCEPLQANLYKLMRERNLNEANLAKQTNIPQPTLHKILTGKTEDPRASTLKILADFFQTSIDDLLSDKQITQQKNSQTSIQSIPILSWSECISYECLAKDSLLTRNEWATCEFISKNAYGLISKPSMEPRFPKGTILIINPEISPEDGDIVVTHYFKTEEATLREYSIDGPTKLLFPLNQRDQPSAPENVKILGILIKSIFAYHT